MALLSHTLAKVRKTFIVRRFISVFLPTMPETLSRKQLQYANAEAKRHRCTAWLLPYLTTGQPKFLTKDELRIVAMAELGVSKNSFDFAWINAIEETGRHDWYEPLRGRRKSPM